ncbi:ribosomal RNA small subunit methyltransferase A [bacterium (Candidatus Gribaldobacteria) CG23_combo_of_CG06-09_8_20_14_all_37_87_8]|uniref:Ribosomal RNA small subunit methyltransferase A n=2 Tax=Candidatus Gribaldobacteria TaxID=2798536 RepID=A0A2G9ZFE4_9BACT|nr:MAG: ribosomal RNA small subunit methyltransferase A [Parcubacteria group bacterium CG1_02_37_13]PIP31896.1 MAG: ribosomal RNA small subunit methyltransferase A [bacterium (Candidatus Gribaldobacteria) CG23_combo_of_CG06-09_8_20_14_all_37_87_8]PIR90213.1 MAG: ribosomal RNA small subunit methyltransferase A [bacterium (Candidatus Gribaldobacteria) CG10_big_fil_rev_8_21_14_0_10_37_21]
MQQDTFKVKTTLSENKITPKKKLGQNFILSKGLAEKFVQLCQINKDDIVLEIGSGLGALTFETAKLAKKVIALEVDSTICSLLKENIKEANIKNIEVLCVDALGKRAFSYILHTTNYQLIGNLPFSTGVAILMKYLESPNPPQTINVILQKEVAQRITTKPPQMEKLAVFCQALAEPKILSNIKKGNFFPEPKIDSTIIQFTNIQETLNQEFPGPPKGVFSDGYSSFQRVVNAGFAFPRKTLLNNLSRGLVLNKEKTTLLLKQAGLLANQRPQELSVSDWLGLTKNHQRGCTNI